MKDISFDYLLPRREVIRWRMRFIWPYLIGFIACLVILSISGVLMGYHHSPIDAAFWIGVGLIPLAAAGSVIAWFFGFTFGDQLPEKRHIRFLEDRKIEVEGEDYFGRKITTSFECAGFLEKDDHYYFYSARGRKNGVFLPKSLVSAELICWMKTIR